MVTNRASMVAITLMVAFFAASQPLRAGVIVVDGACTLVDAITAAETDAATGACPAGSGADEIRLTVDVSLTAANNMFLGSNGLPVITSDITIRGNDHEITRSPGSADFRFFFVDYGGDLTLIDTVLSNGRLPTWSGGAIYSRNSLSLINATISGSSAISGGGLLVDNLATITDSTIIGNSAPYGGGIAIGDSSTVVFTNSTISGNDATNGDGGGIFADSSTVSLVESTISGNSTAFYGGGMAVQGGSVVVTDSTIALNDADGWGGGVVVNGEADSTMAVLTNSTLSGNSAIRGGGIIAIDDATASLTNSTVSGNSASEFGGGVATLGLASVSLENSLVAHSPSGGNCVDATDNGNNLADDNTCGGIPDSLTDLDPVLADNGGPTMTHALLAGSNAIDLAGDCGLSADQRLFLRHDGSCDSGSFEYGAVPTVKIFSDGFESGSTFTWSATVP